MKPEIYLAPMAGVTDLSFRLICRQLGARHCFYEMVDSMSVLYKKAAGMRLLKTIKKDTPISVQLLGSKPEIMLDAAQKLLSRLKVSSLDINSGCPAKKIIKKGAGAALLNDPKRLGKILKNLSDNLKIPITVKLRAGFNKIDLKDISRTARICRDSGASCIFIHGRTKSQGYSGNIDYSAIKAVKESVDIPVFGSGNVFNPALAKKMLDETGCDGILVARGAMGNPWIFKNIENYLKTGRELKAPTWSEKKKILKKHLAYMQKYKDLSYPTKAAIMGKVAMWYFKGRRNAAKIRGQLSRMRSYKDLLSLINRA